MKRAVIYEGDCEEVIPAQIAKSSVNLIVTSPPYADQRKGNYGGIHADRYVKWFLPKSAVFMEALAEDGSFVLNIKEKAIGGEKHRYVYELALAMRDQGWRLVDEYCWHKKNSYPGKWPNRFRDSWERLYHFLNLTPKRSIRRLGETILREKWIRLLTYELLSIFWELQRQVWIRL